MTIRPLRTPSQLIAPEVMSAALQLLSEAGPEGFTVRAIARRARVAPMAIYNHFDGKDGLLEAIWVEGFTILREALGAFGEDPRGELLKAGLAYRRFALDHRSHYTVMFMHRFVGFVPSLDAEQVAAQAFLALVNHIERCQSVGMFKGRLPSDIGQMLWAASHGYVALEIMGINFASDADATFENFLSSLEHGINELSK